MCDQIEIPKLQLEPSSLGQNLVSYVPACGSPVASEAARCGKSVSVSGTVPTNSVFHIKVQRLAEADCPPLAIALGSLTLSVGADLGVSAALLGFAAVEGEASLKAPGSEWLEFYVELADLLTLYSVDSCNNPFSKESPVTMSFGAAQADYDALRLGSSLPVSFNSVQYTTDECLPALAVEIFAAQKGPCVPQVKPGQPSDPSTPAAQSRGWVRVVLVILVLLVMAVLVVLAVWMAARLRGKA